MDADKLKVSETTDGKPPMVGWEVREAPQPINPATGQHGAYWVLSPEERAKGFIRPVRRTYKHVGVRPSHPIRILTDDEKASYDRFGYVVFEAYTDSECPAVTVRYWTQAQLDSGCGGITSMGTAIAETYARDPKYYGSTFCVQCGKHFRVEEFVWVDDPGTGKATEERLGS